MIKKTIFIFAGIFLLLSSVSLGQMKLAVDDIYTATTNPGSLPLTDAVWTPYTGGSHTVLDGTDFWIGIENIFDNDRVKTLRVHLTGSNVSAGHAITVTGFDASRDLSGIDAYLDKKNIISSSEVELIFKFDPQPEWEVVWLHANGTFGIESIEASSNCRAPVPSLTQWGMIVLALLLIGSTIFIFVRRRGEVTA